MSSRISSQGKVIVLKISHKPLIVLKGIGATQTVPMYFESVLLLINDIDLICTRVFLLNVSGMQVVRHCLYTECG